MIRVFVLALGLAAPIVALALTTPTNAVAQTAPNGATLYASCKACHTIAKGGKHGVGPALNGVGKRKAGTAPGFKYSPAMKAYNKPWTAAQLNAFLADPRKTVPGNHMIYPGMKDAAKRAAMVAWIMSQ